MTKSARFTIEWKLSAYDDLSIYAVRVQRQIADEIELYLGFYPTRETRRIKRLRPNPVGGWELRLGDYRALFDVDDLAKIVIIKVIGEKRGNQLFVRGKEFHDHESD